MKLRTMILLGMMFIAGCSGCAGRNGRARKLVLQFEAVKSATAAGQFDAAAQELKLAVPQSAEEVRVLSAEMEGKAYGQAQEVMSKVTDKTLIPVLLEVMQEKKQQLRMWSEKEMQLKSQREVMEIHRKLGNVEVLIALFGEMKDARTIPALKELLDFELLRYQASTALSRMGDEKEIAELLNRAEKEKNINISGDKALQKLMSEINDPDISPARRAALTNQIKGSAKPEVAEMLRELALNSPYENVREQAGLALVNAIILNPKAADPEFLVRWVEKENGIGKTWAVDAMRLKWDERYVPTLLKLLEDKDWENVRSKAAYVLGLNKITESVPALEKALLDNDSGVRSSAIGALVAILGKEEVRKKYVDDPKYIHPKDREISDLIKANKQIK